MTNYIAISEARSILPELVTNINDSMDRTIITVHGDPKVVMISLEELESLEETAEVLSIPNIKEDIKASKRQISQGQYVKFGELNHHGNSSLKKRI